MIELYFDMLSTAKNMAYYGEKFSLYKDKSKYGVRFTCEFE